jgi:hypothetical protein
MKRFCNSNRDLKATNFSFENHSMAIVYFVEFFLERLWCSVQKHGEVAHRQLDYLNYSEFDLALKHLVITQSEAFQSVAINKFFEIY